MTFNKALTAVGVASLLATSAAQADNLVIATVNNGDMVRMQGLTQDFTDKYYVSVLLLTSPLKVARLTS